MDTTIAAVKPKRNRVKQRCAVNALILAGLRAAVAPSPVESRAQIITIRKTLRMAQGELAALLGAPFCTYRRWEDGTYPPTTIARHRINDVFQSLKPLMAAAVRKEQATQKRQKSATPTSEGQGPTTDKP